MRPSDAAKHLVAALAMYLVTLPALWPMLSVVDAPISPSVWGLVVLSGIANVMVLSYHHVVPAHPKFSLIPWRRWTLAAHIVSGTIEFVAGVVACALGGNALAGMVMAITGLLVHIPTAYLQTPTVFGSRAIMRPSYLLCIGLHAFCAVMLLQHPSSLYWTVGTFLLFNTYVWVRVYFYLLDKFGFFQGAKYTVAVLLAGLTTTPYVLGPTVMMVIVGAWVVFILVHSAFFVRSRSDFHEFLRERARDSAYSDGVLSLWRGADSGDDLAREFFDLLDANGDGYLEPDELVDVLMAARLPARAVRHFMESQGDGGKLTYEAFVKHLWTIPELRRVADEVVFTRAGERSEHAKAHFVFRRLDVDGDGVLTRPELEGLLSEWAMPVTEVRRWLSSIGLRDDEDVNFDVFYEKMRPIWRFIYYDILEARYGNGHDLIERVFDAWRDDAERAKLTDDLRAQLVRRISFLSDASDTFIEELAACLVEDERPAESILFVEGDPGEDFWVVRSGRIRVTHKGELLGELGDGDWLGEGALLARRPRNATAIALVPTVLYRASAASFAYLLERHPEVATAVDALDEERRLERAMLAMRVDLLGRVPFLRGLTDDVVRQLAERLQRREVEGMLIEQGTKGDAFFLISAGGVSIYRDGHPITELGPGSFFGEAALFEDGLRNASAIALAGTVVYALGRSDFEWLVAEQPEVRKHVHARHLARTEMNAQ